MNLSSISTYQTGVLQARAHRVLKQHIAEFLRPHNLTMMQWSVLGCIFDASPDGVRISDVAKSLDTSLAFVTNTVNALQQKGLVTRAGHATDNRAKLVKIVPSVEAQIKLIEADLRKQMNEWLNVSLKPDEYQAYMNALDHIAQLEHRELKASAPGVSV